MNEKMRNFQGEEPTYNKGGKTMKTKLKTLMKNQKGMTLIELLAVIVIIAIIALIAIPAIGSIIQKSQDKAILSDASQMLSGAKIAISDGACDTTTDTTIITCSAAVLKDYVEDADMVTADKVVKTISTGAYQIDYTKLNKIETESILTALGGSKTSKATSISNKTLAKAMGNKGSKTTETE